ncbi:GAP family protein [Micromonospora sp. NPDC126480]|uniref:GAP family protein n=1 Tax=Micromonospora sp. NPDC126480 TaxID=3155312 RepID=UPI00331CE827
MDFVGTFPLAVVMVAGTPLVAAVFLASADRPRAASVGYLGGAALVVAGGTTLSWLVTRTVKVNLTAGGQAGRRTVETGIDWFVLAVLVVLAVVVFRRRRSGPPSWLGRLQRAGPAYAARLAALLLGAMPTDDLTMLSVGASTARHDLPWWHLLPFVLVTVLLLALPLLALLLLGSRAAAVLPRMRDWADRHSWVISEAVIALFLLLTVLDLRR